MTKPNRLQIILVGLIASVSLAAVAYLLSRAPGWQRSSDLSIEGYAVTINDAHGSWLMAGINTSDDYMPLSGVNVSVFEESDLDCVAPLAQTQTDVSGFYSLKFNAKSEMKANVEVIIVIEKQGFDNIREKINCGRFSRYRLNTAMLAAKKNGA